MKYLVVLESAEDRKAVMERLRKDFAGAEVFEIFQPTSFGGELEKGDVDAALKALRESRSFLEQAEEVGRMGTWVSGLGDDNSLIWSKQTCRIFGMSEEEFDGRVETFFSFVHPDDVEPIQKTSGRAIEVNEPYELDHRIILKDGSVRWVKERANVIRDSNGNAVKLLGVVQDITERVLAQEELLKSEQRLRRYFSLPLVGMAVDSPDGIIIETNDKLCEMLGYPKSELIGMSWRDLTHPDDIKENARLFEETISGKTEGFMIDKRLIRRDGSLLYASISARSVHRPDGAVDHLVLIIQDITERKLSELKLKESEERFQAFMNNSPATAFIKDDDGRLLFINLAFERDFEFQNRDWYGKNDFELWDEETARQLRQNDVAVLTENRPRAVEETMLQRDGRHYWITFKFPFENAYGRRFIAGMGLDVTERKLAEEEIKRFNEKLEARVVERTAQLEAANKELEMFSYTVSHDLRAPLRHIDGFMNLLIKREGERLDATSARYLDIMSEAARKMGRLIDELLDFSRINRSELKRRPVQLNDLAEEALHELSPEFEGRNIVCEIDPLPEAEGDPNLLRLVFSNLLSNAIKYTSLRPQARIKVSAKQSDNGETVIFVEDNGVGFDMKYADKLFGVFQRLHRDDEFKGVGIGLATVRRIIHRHGGRIWAESELGKGAAFYFTLKGVREE